MRKAATSPSFARASGAVTALAALGLLLTGCGGGESSSSANPAVQTVNSPAEIARESAENYHDNVNGLITGQTLMRWIDDWQNNRPDGIDGRLVILQLTEGTEGKEYITPKPQEGVLTYRIDGGSRLVENRSNGLIDTRSMVPSGPVMDDFLKAYDLDPRNDMIVWVVADGGYFNLMQQGRGWYMMRYWGTPHENLAVLNGLAVHDEVMDPSYLGSVATCDEPVSEGDCLPGNGTVSVRDLPEDNISLQATVEDVIRVAEGHEDDFIWDARSENEYTAWTGVSDGKHRGIDFRNNASKQGHPNGAVVLPYSNMLMSDGTLRYKPKDKLWAYMNGEEVDGAMFQRYEAGSLVPVGPGNAYQPGQDSITYCETTFRAMITGFATAAILGLPNRFYDGAMVEWNSLSGGVQDKYGSFVLPADSPWRTDLPERSHFEYNTPADIDSRDIQDAYAERTNAVTSADRNYRMDIGGGNGGGDDGGVAPPSNPCGG
ncbi:MAG: sulfurtransferase [Pseudomonadota bacterium]